MELTISGPKKLLIWTDQPSTDPIVTRLRSKNTRGDTFVVSPPPDHHNHDGDNASQIYEAIVFPTALAKRLGITSISAASAGLQESRETWDIIVFATTSLLTNPALFWSAMYFSHPDTQLVFPLGQDISSPWLKGWRRTNSGCANSNLNIFQPRKVFYQINVDYYDSSDLKNPQLLELHRLGWDIVYFTDRPIQLHEKAPFVQVRTLPLSFNGDPRRSYKYVKIKPYHELSDYAVLWYSDTNIRLKRELIDFVMKEMKSGHRFVTTHHHGNCVYEESEIILRNELELIEIEARQKQRFRLHDKLPEKYGLLTSAVVIQWLHLPKIRLFNETWMQEVMNSSRRDQAAFVIAKWRLSSILKIHPPLSITLPLALIAGNRRPHCKRSRLKGSIEDSLRFIQLEIVHAGSIEVRVIDKLLEGFNEWLTDNGNSIFYVSETVPVRLWPYVGETLSTILKHTHELRLVYAKSSPVWYGQISIFFAYQFGFLCPSSTLFITLSQ